nr:MAG TPA: hypothetical protein [Caudoviricetes sp.]
MKRPDQTSRNNRLVGGGASLTLLMGHLEKICL